MRLGIRIIWGLTHILCGALSVLALVLGTAPSTFALPPANFQNTILLLGLNEPTTLTFTPDGTMWVLERGGIIYSVPPNSSQVNPIPVLQLNNINTDEGERGLVGIALDPAFATNGYYYIFYTANAPLRDRVSRFTASGNLTVAGSEVVIWQDDVDADLWHHGGALAFGPDGKLYIATGDHFDANYGGSHVSQRLNSYRGKILRLNADGTVPPDNPFHDGAGPNLDAIWALGLRNPFRFSFDSQTGAMYIGDVGSNTWTSTEEVNLGLAGANYGWPWCEGICGISGMTNPIFSYGHSGRDAAIVGGFVYRGTRFPPEYRGSYFYGDYAQNWIRRLTFDANGNVTGNFNFEPSNGAVDGPYGEIVDLKPGPDGNLYYVDIGPLGAVNAGSVRVIKYTGLNNPPIIASVSANPISGPTAPLTVTFTGIATDPENDPLTYQWTFGDGITAATVNAVHSYIQKGAYTARLAVSDGVNQTFSAPLPITVGQPPTATIISPPSGSMFRAGDVITYAGSASDNDGVLAASNYSWTILFHHDDHVHPGAGPITGVVTNTFTIPTGGHDFSGNVYYEIILTVTDSDGLVGTDSVLLFPEKVNLTFITDPPGLVLSVDSATNITTPFTRDTLINFQHSVSAPLQQTLGGVTYNFVGWSDGGEAK